MAYYVQIAAGNYNAANNYYTSDKQQTSASSGFQSLSSTRESAFLTWASNHNTAGVILAFSGSATPCDKSVVVECYNGANLVATRTLTPAEIIAGNSYGSGSQWTNNGRDVGIYLVDCRWASPVAVTSGSTCKYKLYQTGGTTGNWLVYFDSTSGPWFIEYTTTTSNAPTAAANDVLLSYNTTFSASQSIPNNIWQCTGTTITFNDSITITPYSTSSVTPFKFAANTAMKAGTNQNPCTALVFDFSSATTCNFMQSIFNYFLNGDTKNTFELYGSYPATERAELNATISIGATSFITSDNVSAWQNGWKFFFSNRVGRGYVQEYYTLNGVPTNNGNGTYTVNFTPSLANAGVHVGTYHIGRAHLIDGYGIQFKGNSSFGVGLPCGWPLHREVKGVSFFFSTVPNDIGTSGSPLGGDFTRFGSDNISHIAIYNRSPFGRIFVHPGGTTISDIQVCGSSFASSLRYETFSGDAVMNYSNIFINSSTTGSISLLDNNINASNVFITNPRDQFILGLSTGTNISGTINNLRIKGFTYNVVARYGVLALSGSNVKATNIYIDDCDCALDCAPGGFNINTSINNLYLALESSNSYGLNWQLGSYWDLAVSGGSGAWTFTGSQGYAQQNTQVGTNIQSTNYAGTAGDYRSWTKTGQFVSNGTTKMTQKFIGAGLVNYWSYRIMTEAVSGTKIYAAIKCQIANSAFYGGTHTKPSFTVTYDGSSTVSASAAGNTNEQMLSVIFTPTQDGTELKATISGVTDQTTSGNVDWSAIVFNLRKIGKIYTSYSYIITHVSKDLILNLSALNSNPFWTTDDSTAATWLAKLSYDGTTLTILDDITASQIYQAMQYWGRLDANMESAIPYDTLDGSNFICTANLTVVANKTVSGTGGQKIIVAAGKALTLTGNAMLPITTDTGTRTWNTLSGIESGATYRIEKTADGTLITEGTASGSTVGFAYTWTSDLAVTGYAAHYGKRRSVITGTLTSINVGLLFSLATEPFVVADVGTAAAITGITESYTNRTLVLSISLTLQEIFDRLNYTNALLANIRYAPLIGTVNGLDRIGDFAMTVDTGVSLNGTGSLDLGARMLTLSGTATYADLVRILHSAGVSKTIILSGLANGRNYRIEKQSDASLVYEGTATGPAKSIKHLWTVDIPVRLITGQYGYVRNDALFTISSQVDAASAPNDVEHFVVADAGAAAAITGITEDYVARTLTLSVSRTLQEIFDRLNYTSAQLANLSYSPLIGTINGLDRTGDFAMTVDTGISLNGTGSLDLGARSLTLSGTATYADAIRILHSAGVSKTIILSSLANGRNYRIEKQSDASLVYEGTATGSAKSIKHLWTADIPVRLITGQYGYRKNNALFIISSQVDTTNAPNDTEPFIVADVGTAASYTGITLDCQSRTGIITATRSVQELFDYHNYHQSMLENLTYAPLLSTVSGIAIDVQADLTCASGGIITSAVQNLAFGASNLMVNAGGGISAVCSFGTGGVLATADLDQVTGRVTLTGTALWDISAPGIAPAGSAGTSAKVRILSANPADLFDFRTFDFSATTIFENTDADPIILKLLPSQQVPTKLQNPGLIAFDNAVSITLSAPHLLNGSRIRLFNETANAEIDNALVAGGAGYSILLTSGINYTIGDILRFVATYHEGGLAKRVFAGSAQAQTENIIFGDSQIDWDEYNAIGIDGADIPECSTNYAQIQVEVNDPDNSTKKSRIAAFIVHALSEADGIRNWVSTRGVPVITFKDAGNAIINVSVAGVKIDNIKPEPLNITDTFHLDASDGSSLVDESTHTIRWDNSSDAVVVAGGGADLEDVEAIVQRNLAVMTS